MNSIITLKDYLGKNKTFVIPAYQRGYVWGKEHDGEKDSVENLIDDLIKRFNRQDEIFLQGVTVTETSDEVVLIDGQQRTTCLYILLKCLGYQGKFEIRYDIRKESDDYLRSANLNDVIEESGEEEYQDIFFFKKTARIIQSKLKGIDKIPFLDYVLNKVKFLYINIAAEQATKVFAMMNGNKAKMLQEEIIKAEILRLASLNNDSQIDYSQEWEYQMLRSRYAREWDKWLHWWNDNRVQSLFCCHNTMGLLISSYLQSAKDENLTFEQFKVTYLCGNTSKEAKDTFDGLRRLQKRFEDAFNDTAVHNRIGAILRIFDKDNQKKFIQYYFVEDNRKDLEDYYKLIFLGMTHDEIIRKEKSKFADKYDMTYRAIDDDYLYLSDSKEIAFRFLLRLNVDQDILQKRFFNFDVWGERSLEHIWPKSKVIHQDAETKKWFDGNNQECAGNEVSCIIKREDICMTDKDGKDIKTTEHSIGNLVLLYKNENSKFNDSDFLRKKELFFSPHKTELFRSRHLLHTICVFAEKEHWNGSAIAENKINTIREFENDYTKLKKEYRYEEQD